MWNAKAKTMKGTYDLLNEPIPRLIRMLAIPASTGFFFNTMFNVVDTWYGGLISTDALASLSISFPVFFIIIALSAGTSTGATALIAHALGEGDEEKAKLYSAQALTFGFFTALGITLIGWLSAPSIFRLLGASGQYLEMALAYMNVIFAGTLSFIACSVFNAPLTARGDTKTFRNTLIAGCLLNLLLNPWFIFGGFGVPALGFQGIALSSIVIESLSGLYIAYKAVQTGLISRKCFALLWPRAHYMRDLARNIFPASINMLTVGIGIFLTTYYISRFDKNALAAYGIATRIEQIVLLPSIGLNMATLAIVGQNFGAQQYERIKETVKTSISYGFGVMLIGGTGVFTFAPSLMALFTEEAEVIATGTRYLRIAAWILWAYVILFVATSALQGMKRPMYAIWIGLYRQVVAPLIVFHLLTQILGWGLYSLWWGIFFITWSAALFTFAYTRFQIRGMGTASPS